MEEIKVNFKGKNYFYKEIDNIMIWQDELGEPVPVMLHSLLREKSLKSGTAPSAFLTMKIINVPDKKSVAAKASEKSSVTKKSLIGGFNPFS